ncbi:type IV toxin-antitoxin system AbiEi family antitoxin domain-containing protein [Tahibacter amnicola]|uniref:Type IV toxin-antitoxin system AbiEi family antitoxin domain-containing protein n=1 Tax=Tahibacter amnicola TaxID=2976241 RepID=A0ABY6BG86_9GAMM|nr:type IV toxin-antitoxin system AbiEi family antitoxin domain-containing protein [Tahibacter amnicola]UXI68090.1 type IV toxin-antitoxin system AbiEi family antitoxin domain-containing protein [Tahibacter amnicola]
MTVSRRITHILRLAHDKGLLRPVDLEAAGIPRVYLTRLIARGLLEKVGRGVYRLGGSEGSELEGLQLVASKVPQAVFCLLTALQFHELTTQLPRRVWITLPRGSHLPKLDHPPLKMIQASGDAYASGVEIHTVNNVELRVFCIAKTIADCFKHRSKIGIDAAIEALKEAKTRGVTNDSLWHFAKICRVTHVMRPYLQALE